LRLLSPEFLGLLQTQDYSARHGAVVVIKSNEVRDLQFRRKMQIPHFVRDDKVWRVARSPRANVALARIT
jgi:hypothetical protein